MKKRLHVIIKGRVHGVFFRSNTRDVARRFGLSGWVRNNSDGTVEAIFEGEEDSLRSVLNFCEQGPTAAIVDSVESKWKEYEGEFVGFNIRY